MNLPSERRAERVKFLGKSAALSLCAVLVAAGCSGGGSSGSGTPKTTQNLNVGGPDNVGNTFNSATAVRVGDGVVESYVNTPGDIDYYRFDLAGGNLYGIQFAGLDPSNTEGDLGELVYDIQFIDPESGVDLISFPAVGSAGFPAGVDSDISNLTDIFIAPFSGRYYLSFRGRLANDIGKYTFRLTSSRLGEAFPRGDARFSGNEPSRPGNFVYNIRSYTQIFDPDEGFELYEGPATSFSDSADNFIDGILIVPWIQLSSATDGNIPATFTPVVEVGVPFFDTTPEIFFKNEQGEVNTDPEVPVVHIHFGIPSSDLNDGIDDILWFGENTDSALENWRDNLNAQDSPDIHPVIATVGDSIDFGEELFHLIVSQDWYMDGHFTSNLEAYPFPIVSSHPHGGIHFFDSAFVLNGFETVPATGSTRELEVVYNDAHQVFYIPYDVSSELAGSRIHVHAGGPGEEAPGQEILIDLGTVPALAARPYLETAQLGTIDFIPGVENIIKRLTDAEAKRLRDASFSTGWYIDVHTEPFFTVKPEIRADARLETNLEIATSTVSFDEVFQGGGRQGLVKADGSTNLAINAKSSNPDDSSLR